MEKFSVKKVSELAGVSIRTLHYYDEIGLLKPSIRAESNYRYYTMEDILRLQQIMFYRELDIPLANIAEILDEENFNLLEALKGHKKELQKRRSKLRELINTINTTIDQLNAKNTKMNYEELYKGFSPGQAEAYEQEAKERWGEKTVEDSKKRVMKMSKEDWEKTRQESDAINRGLAELMHLDPSDSGVQTLVARHYQWVNQFWDVTPDAYRGLGQMYVEDERFKANYEKYKTGLAEFMYKAMLVYADGQSR